MQIAENKEKHVKTVIFCQKHNIPLGVIVEVSLLLTLELLKLLKI